MHFELKKEDWKTFLDNLTKRRYEWMTDIEVISPDAGSQTLSNGLPLNGITLETLGDNISIDISVGETTGNHQTHMIRNPTTIAFLAGDATHGDVVDIEEANGTKTLLRFTEPMGVLVGMAEYEMVVTA